MECGIMLREKMFRKMLFILIVIITMTAQPLQSQWAKIYEIEGCEFAASTILSSHDGGNIGAGSYVDWNEESQVMAGWIMALTKNGDIEWARHFNTPVISLTPTVDGGYAAVGSGGIIFKIDAFGEVIWARDVKINHFVSIERTRDGGFITAGIMFFRGEGGSSIIIKFSKKGKIQWQRKFAVDDDSGIDSIKQTPDGGFIAVGNTKFPKPYPKGFWIMKISPRGKIKWQKRFGGNDHRVIEDFAVTSRGDYILLGNNYRGKPYSSATNIWVIKLRSDGEIVWQKLYGGYGSKTPNSLINTKDGGCLISGRIVLDDDFHFLILKLRSKGKVEWSKVFGGSNENNLTDVSNEAYSAYQTNRGKYFVIGSTNRVGIVGSPFDLDKQRNIVILKLNKNGGLNSSSFLKKGPYSPVLNTFYSFIDSSYSFRNPYLKAINYELGVKDIKIDSVNNIKNKADFAGAKITAILDNYK